jgi:hypothetical protein
VRQGEILWHLVCLLGRDLAQLCEPARDVDSQGNHVLTEVHLPGPTKAAGPTQDIGVDDDVIPYFERLDLRTYGFHDPRKLVSWNQGKISRKHSVEDMQVGPTNT